jgi:dienelactone hydrolase
VTLRECCSGRLNAVWLLALPILPVLIGCTAQGVQSNAIASAPTAANDVDGGQAYSIPVIDNNGRTIQLRARVCRPAAETPSPLVVINHGSPHSTAERPHMQLGRCDAEPAQWFIRRGYVVAFALRRGYGATGGAWAESFGSCSNPDYVHAGIETARDINAVVEYLTALPFVKSSEAIVVGQSAGGWGTIAYNALPHPRVRAFVVMAGGRGGHENNELNRNCDPAALALAARHFGSTATTPMLWIYAANDTYFGPPIAQALWRAFTTAGGKADLRQPSAFDGDGHHLLFGAGGSAVWGPLVEHYLSTTP